jgi:nucleoside-diphosphate-sugar epimerase
VPARRHGVYLVTGGSGLLGSRLVRRLLGDGHKVRVLDTRYGELGNAKTRQNLEFVGIGESDLHGGMVNEGIVEEAMRNVVVVHHLAINWNGSTWRHRLPLPDLFDANVRGTLNLLEAARSHKVEHFLLSSSAAVYGETQRTVSRNRASAKKVVDEESACKPYIWKGDPGPAYAILKLAMENLCLMYHYRYGLPVTALRIEYIFANQEQLNDGANIHVDDVVQAFQLATLNRKAYGEVFNIAYSAPYISTRKTQTILGWKPHTTKEFLKTSPARVRD